VWRDEDREYDWVLVWGWGGGREGCIHAKEEQSLKFSQPYGNR